MTRSGFGPGNLGPLGVARIAIGALIVLRTTPLLAPLHIAFSSDSYPLLGWPSARFSLAWLPADAIRTLCVVRTLGGLALMLGVWPRVAGVACGLSGYLVAAQSVLGVPCTLQLLYEAAVLLGISDAGAVLALQPARVRSLRSSTWLLRSFVASVYLWAGLFKLRPDWLDGRTLQLLHQAGALHGALPTLLLGTLGAASPIAWGVALFEVSVGPMLLWASTRPFALALAYSFHAAVALTADPDFLGWAMMALLSCFWDARRATPAVVESRTVRGSQT